MGKKREMTCRNCDGDGWEYDYLGGCGPYKVQCRYCDNDWSPDDDEDDK